MENTCDCDWDTGPCEQHGTVLVVREGASHRTADELALQLCHDLVDCGAELSPWGAFNLRQADERAAQCRNPHTGTMWFDDDGTTLDALVTLADQLEADLGIGVYHDDGYVIVRATDDCPLYN